MDSNSDTAMLVSRAVFERLADATMAAYVPTEKMTATAAAIISSIMVKPACPLGPDIQCLFTMIDHLLSISFEAYRL